MIIKRIKIKNYKTYLSLDLDLSVNPDQPIILIGGMNGGGKTTLFEAICGALYGLKIQNKAHFQELLNNGALGKVEPTIVLELSFEGMVLGRKQQYLLRRTYKLNPANKPVENVLLNMDGTPFSYGTATPPQQRAINEQQVNKIIKANLPQELSKYFLFDAMQSSELLKENVFAQIIKDNIQNVMGFNKYLQLKNAAEHQQQEWAARRLEAQKEAEEYNGLCEQRNQLVALQEENTKHQDDKYKYLVSIQAEYDAAKEGAKDSAETARKIQDLEASVKDTQELSKRYNAQLKQVVETLEINVFFPKLAQGITNEVNDIIRQKEALKQEREGVLSLEQMREVTTKILGYLKSKCLCPDSVEDDDVVAYLKSQQEALQRKDDYAFLDESEFDALKNLLGANAVNEFVALNDSRYDLEKRLENYDNQQSQIALLRRSMVSGNTEIIKAYEEASRELEILKKEADDRKVSIEKLERKIHQFDVQIQQEPDVKYDMLVKLKPFFEDVADTLLKRKKEKIEEDMKEQLNKLLISYKGCIAKVELSDSMENFTIRLYHKAGNEISLNQLNAASKQIFIQVLLKVLRNLGDYNPPVMIDTVMGVLDEESRDVLMEEYFPGLAEQTILLCTTSEIRKDKDYMKLEPFLSRSYTLVRDVESQSTHVEKGYFGVMCNE
ncbi:AAA family ATPase [Prevotella sp.]|uniref:AAA family ATPase n=1 Tax=Prevotella sp. TaxID=59823 RepID=UPI00307E0F5F